MKVYSQKNGISLFRFHSEKDEHGNIYNTAAFATDPQLGLMKITAYHWYSGNKSILVEFSIAGTLVEIRVNHVDINIRHRPTFSRQFNRYIRPRAIQAARGLGLIGGG